VTVIFVCTGNTCRSPLAEALARKMAAERGITGVTFASAGTGALDGALATDASILVGLERNVDLSLHRARNLTANLVDSETLILVLATSHLAAVRAIAPSATVYLLDEYASHGERHRSVPDPFGGDLEEYRAAADTIESMLPGTLDRIASEGASNHR
jgi:protein-tyrosine-phosphatase